jgi:sulfite dehydrogenase (cytochrome) subunit B
MVWVVVAFSLAVGVAAQQISIKLPEDNALSQLKPGPAEEIVRRNCSLCHSTDYIVTQPHLDAARWEGEVTKMIQVFGAPISNSDAKTIAEYLASNYGSDKLPSRPEPASGKP